MIVLQIQVGDVARIKVKSDTPITRNGNTPPAGPVADELMYAPAGRPAHFVHILGMNKCRDYVPHPLQLIRSNPLAIIRFDERLQTFMPRRANSHFYLCTVQPYACQFSLEGAGETRKFRPSCKACYDCALLPPDQALASFHVSARRFSFYSLVMPRNIAHKSLPKIRNQS